MKKQAINLSWPAELSNFSIDEKQGNFTRGKLKVFYKGETGDHRFFSDDFSEELIKSLPYTPIVSYYDEEKEDFVGHATQQQILGIVDPCVEPSFCKGEDGFTWCVCDTVLFTERPDLVGELAKKIEGHSQSLELDPNSVKYTINYDEKKHFKNIEFTAGKFVGVSVLGKDQKPAFTGSQFFAYDEEFEKKMNMLREYCESQKDQAQHGGKEMDLNEFMKLSWGEISIKVGEAIAKEYNNDAYIQIVDMFEDSCICKFYYYLEEVSKLMRVYYTNNEGEISLGNVNEVYVSYVDVVKEDKQSEVLEAECKSEDEDEDEEDKKDEKDDYACGGKKKKCGCEEQPVFEEMTTADIEQDSEATEVVNEADAGSNEDAAKEESTEETDFVLNEDSQETSACPAQVENVAVTPEFEEVSVNNEQETNNKEDSSSTSFTESEREEFEALKREKKITLVNSYKDILDEETIKDFMLKIDSFEKEEDLELALLKEYKKTSENQTKPMRAFAFAPINDNAKKQDSLDTFVKRYLRK